MSHLSTAYQSDIPEEYRSEWIGPQFAHGFEAACAWLFPLVRSALPYIEAQAQAEHMLDGFGPQEELPVDELVKRMKEVIG